MHICLFYLHLVCLIDDFFCLYADSDLFILRLEGHGTNSKFNVTEQWTLYVRKFLQQMLRESYFSFRLRNFAMNTD